MKLGCIIYSFILVSQKIDLNTMQCIIRCCILFVRNSAKSMYNLNMKMPHSPMQLTQLQLAFLAFLSVSRLRLKAKQKINVTRRCCFCWFIEASFKFYQPKVWVVTPPLVLLPNLHVRMGRRIGTWNLKIKSKVNSFKLIFKQLYLHLDSS